MGAMICREAGVRNLKKHLEKIYRKVAMKIVKRADKLPTAQMDLPASTSSVGEPELAQVDQVMPTPSPEGTPPQPHKPPFP
jgi:Lon-like ATP-dependent protease